ncbi:MAG: alpha/beta hydrolase [Hoeflea sp.]|uniref:alpha/beta hydrolase n=1 Tax=Hoeflea sp. TaxID=1940281 RepID=UPI001DB2BAD1|nr:alpha/beta hydrolase [Hoeflea sp.]MBU4527328.1 alpha/beta hydrolase [Alphaproteobacteria bacterium]MBU4546889.1 alpha/beta hydrolase [Alphaproteobacteria bacterium]MBU4551599.1 alpha/beta hydrolase [Alphaproteobacteria bacterium]MBV1725604.1 alpha/beta hydrolase [Hoeflea sp.]MBV1759652.1 alpha/beta hydrolase [Hoeflea sp.]
MTDYPIADYDDAYANGAYIDGAADYPPRWAAQAQAFRDDLSASGRARLDLAYGSGPRNRLDLFLPEGESKGLAVFVHGGYWKAFDKSVWSHLAAGPLAHGFAVAMPGYTLCPDNRIAGIGREIAAAIGFAAGEVAGPIRLTGHSAGGQLVTRMISGTALLPDAVLNRVAGVTSISGVHHLRPIMKTAMNDTLHIDAAEAVSESPVLLAPLAPVPVMAWVGAAERPEFVRQNRALYEMWRGLATPISMQEEPGRHHFDVIDGLCDPEHPLCRAFLGLDGEHG